MSKNPKVLGQWQILRPIGKRLITKKPKLKAMSKRQTAVEWLVDELLDGKLLMPSLIEEAKQMEKEQIVDAYDKNKMGRVNYGEQYYNETFRSE